jgi:hypothetical protein
LSLLLAVVAYGRISIISSEAEEPSAQTRAAPSVAAVAVTSPAGPAAIGSAAPDLDVYVFLHKTRSASVRAMAHVNECPE